MGEASRYLTWVKTTRRISLYLNAAAAAVLEFRLHIQSTTKLTNLSQAILTIRTNTIPNYSF